MSKSIYDGHHNSPRAMALIEKREKAQAEYANLSAERERLRVELGGRASQSTTTYANGIATSVRAYVRDARQTGMSVDQKLELMYKADEAEQDRVRKEQNEEMARIAREKQIPVAFRNYLVFSIKHPTQYTKRHQYAKQFQSATQLPETEQGWVQTLTRLRSEAYTRFYKCGDLWGKLTYEQQLRPVTDVD